MESNINQSKKTYVYVHLSPNKDVDQILERVAKLLNCPYEQIGNHALILLDPTKRQKEEGSPYRLFLSKMDNRSRLIVDDLSSLGKNGRELQKELQTLEEKNISLQILSMPATLEEQPNVTSILFDVFSEMARKETQNVKRCQKAGIDQAYAENGRWGRPLTPYPENWESDYTLWKNEIISSSEFLKRSKLKKGTFYNLLKRYRIESASNSDPSKSEKEIAVPSDDSIYQRTVK